MSEARVCSETIWQGMTRYGCSKPAKVQSGGKWYCAVHSPEAAEKRKRKSAELYAAQQVKWRAQRDREKFNEQAGDACRELGIAPAELRDEVARLRGVLQRIAQYGDKGIHGNDGICPYGCDTPHIAQAALDGGKGVQG